MALPFDQTLGLSHPFSVGKNVHSIIANPNAAGTFYADIAARDADTAFQVLENVGKAVGVTSPLSVFVLMSTGPAVWVELGSGDPIDTFLELTDVLETSYTGFALNAVRVNAAETGLEFTTTDAGDVIGPGSSTDNALARFDLATGKLIQNSLGILDDAGALSGLTKLNVDNLQLDLDTLSNTATGNSVILESDAIATAVIKSTAVSPRPRLDFDTGLDINGRIGDFGGGIDTGSFFAQIGWGNTSDLFLAPGLNAAGDIVLYTPDSGVSNLIERLRIKTSTGSALLGSQMSIGALTAPATDTSIDLKSTSAALLFNRLTSTQRDALTPLEGMGLWNTTTDQMENYDGVAWVPMGGGDVSGPATNLDNSVPSWLGVNSKVLQDVGTLFIDGIFVGIGTPTPLDCLHIESADITTATMIRISDGQPVHRMLLGNYSADTVDLNRTEAQFVVSNADTTTSIISRGDFASEIALFTAPDINGAIERMRIKEDGKVGIGIAAPDSLLHSHIGTAGTITSLAGTNLTLESNTTQYLSFLGPDGNVSGILFGQPSSNVHGGIFYDDSAGFQFRNNVNMNRMCIEQDGDVGIGTTSPVARLHVRLGPSGVTIPTTLTTVFENNTNNFLSIVYPNGFGGGILFGDVDVPTSGAISYTATDDFQWSTIDNTVKMFLKSDGSLGIRTTDPKARIHVLNNASSGVTPSVNASDIFVEHTFVSGMTIGTGNTGIGRFGFGDPENNLAGSILYNHNNDFMSISALAAVQINAPEAQFLCAISYERTEIADVNKTVLANEYLLAITSITAARTITFNTSIITGSTIPGQSQHWPIKDESGDVDGTNTVTILTQGSETIDGAASLVLNTPRFDLVIYSDGSNLFVRSG